MLPEKVKQRFIKATRLILQGSDSNEPPIWYAIAEKYRTNRADKAELLSLVQEAKEGMANPLNLSREQLLEVRIHLHIHKNDSAANILLEKILARTKGSQDPNEQATYAEATFLTNTSSPEKAAELGYPHAMSMLAYTLYEPDPRKRQLCEGAMAKGNAFAMCMFAACFVQDPSEKISLYEKAIALDCAPAMFYRACMHVDGASSSTNYHTAVKLFEEALAIDPNLFASHKASEEKFRSTLKIIDPETLVLLLLPRLKTNEGISKISFEWFLQNKSLLLAELLKEPPVRKRTAAFQRFFPTINSAKAADTERLATLNNALDPEHALGKVFATGSGLLPPDPTRAGTNLYRLTQARNALYEKLHPARHEEVSDRSTGDNADVSKQYDAGL